MDSVSVWIKVEPDAKEHPHDGSKPKRGRIHAPDAAIRPEKAGILTIWTPPARESAPTELRTDPSTKIDVCRRRSDPWFLAGFEKASARRSRGLLFRFMTLNGRAAFAPFR